MKSSGDRFEYFKRGKLWYWHLIVSNSPSVTPAAISGRGYPTADAVLKAIAKAQWAAKGAKEKYILVDAPSKSN